MLAKDSTTAQERSLNMAASKKDLEILKNAPPIPENYGEDSEGETPIIIDEAPKPAPKPKTVGVDESPIVFSKFGFRKF